MIIVKKQFARIIAVIFVAFGCSQISAQSIDVKSMSERIRRVAAFGEGHAEAEAAMQELRQAAAGDVPALLAAMNGANDLALNWLRPVVESAFGDGSQAPIAKIDAFVTDLSNDPKPRRLAFELLRRADPKSSAVLLEKMLDDPSAEMRWDAVGALIAKADSESDSGEQRAMYRQALQAARNPDQISSISKSLAKLDDPVDLTKHFGFLMQWYVIGPFDNTDEQGFAVIYPPEASVDLQASYAGKESDEIKWAMHKSEEDEGVVDLNKALGKIKGATAYAHTEYTSPAEQEVVVRLGCINAHKVWINGDLVIDNEVYHAGMSIDQYLGKATLREGKNSILIKVCQNEQTEGWAQEWQFQFRLTDASGKSITADDGVATRGRLLTR